MNQQPDDPAETIARLNALVLQREAEIDRLWNSARRYLWLREQDWFSGPLAVVRNPKDAIKPGHDAPSRHRLDEAIDAAMSKATP